MRQVCHHVLGLEHVWREHNFSFELRQLTHRVSQGIVVDEVRAERVDWHLHTIRNSC